LYSGTIAGQGNSWFNEHGQVGRNPACDYRLLAVVQEKSERWIQERKNTRNPAGGFQNEDPSKRLSEVTMNTVKVKSSNLESLLEQIISKDGATRQYAGGFLTDLGKAAVPGLIRILRDSGQEQARWEAAKILGEIGDPRALPVLVKALEDKDRDVAWLAAEALKRFKQAAWLPLLVALLKRGAGSALLRHGAHHVLRNQKSAVFSNLLADLKKALASSSSPESTPVAAYNLLERLQVKS
jgi:HEAT repeat protein